MSTETVSQTGTVEVTVESALDQLVYVDPSELIVDKETDVRFTGELEETAEEIEQIQELAASMVAVGQEQPVRARVGSDGRLYLIAGNRRRRAGLLIREVDPGFMLAAVVSPGEVDEKLALQQAAHENIKRRALTAIQLMLLIGKIRAEYGWKGKAGTAEVAKWLGVSTATVTQTEKLSKLDPVVQKRVHDGTLSADAALLLVKIDKDKQAGALKAAEALQQEEEKAAALPAIGKSDAAVEADKKLAAKGKVRKTGKVQKRHVKRANPDVPAKWSRAEVVEYFAVVRDSPAYGHENGAVRTWAAAFVDKCAGKAVSERRLDQLFGEMVRGAAKGSPAPVQAKAEVKTAAVAKKKSTKKKTKPAPKK